MEILRKWEEVTERVEGTRGLFEKGGDRRVGEPRALCEGILNFLFDF